MVKRHKKLISIILVSIVSILVLVGFIQRQPSTSSTTEINDFHFTDNSGKIFSKENLKGHWSLVFFGFTNCAMVCPTTMAALNGMYQSLQKKLPRNELPQIVFISIDPERDTVERLNEFIHAYNSHFIGARADRTETEILMKQLHIVSAKMQADGKTNDRYMLDHTSDIFVFNPDAKLQALLSYPHQAEQLIKNYKSIIQPAKNDSAFQDTEGNAVQLATLKGKWVILNYWATWCHNCIEEIPELNRFYKHNQAKNIHLYGINFDGLSADELKLAAKQTGIAFPVMTNDPNAAWHLGDIAAIPMTFIIDPDGKVVKTIAGPNTEKSLSAILENLRHANSI